MADKPEMTKKPETARRNDWFEWPDLSRWDLPDVFRWLESRPGTDARIRVEEERRDDHVVIRAELPGIDPDKDVEITLSEGMLHIRAERRQEIKEESEGRVRSEFRYGSFERSLPLPKGATEQDVQASYRDGILEITVPVAAAPAERRKVNVARA